MRGFLDYLVEAIQDQFHFQTMERMTMAKTRIPMNAAWEMEQKRIKVLASAVAQLDLDVRTVNGLELAGILFVSQVVQLTHAELMRIPNFGDKSVKRILRELSRHGLGIREVPIPHHAGQ